MTAVVIGWCLLLNGHSIMGALIALLSGGMMIFRLPKANARRLFLNAAGGMIVMSLISYLSMIDTAFDYFYVFLLCFSLNIAIFTECVYLTKVKAVLPVYAGIIMALLIFLIIGMFIPNTIFDALSRSIYFTFLSMIFMPYAFFMTAVLIRKESAAYKTEKRKEMVYENLY